MKPQEEREVRETILIGMIALAKTKGDKAILLQSYIQKYGGLTDENAEIVRELIGEDEEDE